MSAPRNKLQDYVCSLKKIGDFDQLTTDELFLLGYSVGKHEGRTPISTLATQLIHSHNLFRQGLLTQVQKNMVEYLIFEGTYEGIDGILQAFSASKPSSIPPRPAAPDQKLPVDSPKQSVEKRLDGPLSSPKKPLHDSLPTTQELFDQLAVPSKRLKTEEQELMRREHASDMVVIPASVPPQKVQAQSVPKPEPVRSESKKDLPDSLMQDDEKSIELIKKIQEDEKKELETARQKREAESLDKAECKICMERVEPTEYNPVEPCGHLFHLLCLRKYVETQMNARAFPILCPLPECKSDIDTGYIKDLLEDETFKLFDQYSFKSFVEGKSEEYSCCPTPDCSYVFVWLAKEDSNDFNCPKCKKRYCLNCKCPFHKGMTCKEYEITNKHTTDDDRFLKFVKGKKFKQCPKCKFWVERTMGCNHMVCRCKHQFCYHCGGNYPNCECAKAARAAASSMSARRGRRKRQ